MALWLSSVATITGLIAVALLVRTCRRAAGAQVI